MSIKDPNTLTCEFFALNDYKLKLEFWDKHGLDFKSSTMFFPSLSDFISIVPANDDEVHQYTQWTINHWREHFLNKTVKVKPNTQVRIRSFEELKRKFEARIKNHSLNDISDLVYKEIAFIESQNLSITVNHSLYQRVTRYFERFCEDELIESFKFKTTYALLDLRTLGKLWEFMRYKAYLHLYKLPTHEPNVISSGKVSNQLLFKTFSEDQVWQIHNYLVENKFMKSDWRSFKTIVMERPDQGFTSLVWVERSKRNKPSKMGLFALVERLLEVIPDNNGDFHRYIFKYFTGEDWAVNEKEQINRLKSSLTLYNSKKPGDRIACEKLTDYLINITNGKS